MSPTDAATTVEEELPRLVPLAGCSNLRDLGGYRAADGRRVRFGLVFRSAALSALTEEDLVTFGGLGLRTVCDLRGEDERAHAPSRLPQPAPEMVSLPIEPTVGASLRDILETGKATGEDVLTLLGRAYSAYATAQLPRYRALLDLLAQPGRLPLLFHCSAGKDRTGFGAAILLTALGIPRQVIIEDYLATNRFWRSERVFPPGTDPAVAQALKAAHAPLLEGALATAMREHADAGAFMEAALGLDAARLVTLRDAFLE
jgi:protein-tyrosine phosphatase